MVDLVAFKSHPDVAVNNLEGRERDDRGAWRWGLGPGTVIQFLADGEKEYGLLVEASNPAPHQDVLVEVNGETLGEYRDLPAAPWLEPSLRGLFTFTSRTGVNQIVLRYRDWNTYGANFAQSDKRPLALALTRLLLYERETDR